MSIVLQTVHAPNHPQGPPKVRVRNRAPICVPVVPQEVQTEGQLEETLFEGPCPQAHAGTLQKNQLKFLNKS